MEIFALIVPLLLEGLKVFGEERRTRFKDKYHKHLKRISEAEASSDSYTDVEIDLAKESLKIFLKAFEGELSDHNKEVGNV